jgi:hypothetical protein
LSSAAVLAGGISWKVPRRGKVASLRKQLPAFEAACAAVDRVVLSKLGDQLAAALASSPAVSPPGVHQHEPLVQKSGRPLLLRGQLGKIILLCLHQARHPLARARL